MRVFLTTIFTSLIFTTFGQQTNCESLKKENENLKTLLGLYSDHKKDTVQNIEFSFFRAIGNIKQQTVTIEFLIKNIDVINKNINIDKFDIIDELNNSNTDHLAYFGNEYYDGYREILSNSPKKVKAIISRVAPSTFAYVKNITVHFRFDTDNWKYFDASISGDKIIWK